MTNQNMLQFGATKGTMSKSLVRIAMPKEAALKIHRNPKAFYAWMEANGFPVESVTVVDLPTEKEQLQVQLVGEEHLLSITPDDPIATPLLKSRIANLRKQLQELEKEP